MTHFYTAEKNFQMLISLLKQHDINTVIASPGTTNVAFVASIQFDPYFKVYSAPDERSAAYMACGYAAESGKPVVLTCTGATASRNYIPGLTEAYYRKLPVIAVTSTRHAGYIGQLTPQAIDRTAVLKDVVRLSVQVPSVLSEEDAWNCNLRINEALLAVKENLGPVHINIVAEINNSFDVSEIPEARVIKRFFAQDNLPAIHAPKVGIFIGNHAPFEHETIEAIQKFCEKYNGCVLCDHTSNYNGKYSVEYNLISDQKAFHADTSHMELLIDLGEVSGSYMQLFPLEVWRVSEDGAIQDRFKKLSNVFQMDEKTFFKSYCEMSENDSSNTQYYQSCKLLYDNILNQIPELPFSNIWIAKTLSKQLPQGAILHLGILNSLRSWNFFEVDQSIRCYSNTGGFGIDGILSTLLGVSLADPEKLNFCVLGDLAFFYDMNSLGNHNIGNNIRILLINNGVGTEFKNYSHLAYQFGEAADDYIAAAGHYGNKSKKLVKHYAEDLGFEYLCASSKEEFLESADKFLHETKDKPIVFEVFTSSDEESDALKEMNYILRSPLTAADLTKYAAKTVLGEKRLKKIKNIIRGK
ncbi:2-succinyl-5-enolpyruvyl-6-hydroxy-3-cyclohexene-1-carboxylate synthase [Gemmiger formicilis]|uniref:thiamine pyrophosphate-binding protein n=1 Tax=Gemmiger formicilis TaxID=745368 RepID=UPI00195E6683|nr:thiamine pyrophosphate-binding protein [Gemmiger formicilis]MBM6717078.1 2-succinyl-5-enolpyruvyl-6-hydroxy-3-cyclohexene-1-carboxylate synthase [Gemmiger formicilis]